MTDREIEEETDREVREAVEQEGRKMLLVIVLLLGILATLVWGG